MGVPEGQRPTDAQFVQQLMLSLLGMACFNSERMLEWAAEAFDWFAAVLMPNPVRDCCLIRTNIVCIRVGPYCISICTRQVNALYFFHKRGIWSLGGLYFYYCGLERTSHFTLTQRDEGEVGVFWYAGLSGFAA